MSDPAPVPATVVSSGPPVGYGVPARSGSIFGRILLVFVCLMLGGFMLAVLFLLFGLFSLGGGGRTDGVIERHHSLAQTAEHKIAIIRVEGTIVDGEGYVKHQIDRVRDDPKVKAIVLRVDSPGGTVTGADYILHHLNKLRQDRQLPLVVSMGGLAASGGYYVSMAVGDQTDSIFAEPTTWTGSIGVIIPHYDVSQLAQEFGVESDSVVSHRLKGMGSPLRAMTEEERAIFQTLVDEAFVRFKEIIKQGRPKFQGLDDAAPGGLNEFATGQVFTTEQALAAGLVDREGFLEEAIDRALELAGLTKENTQVVDYENPSLDLFNLLAAAPAEQPRGELQQLIELSTPRAWYLCSWLPPLTAEHLPAAGR